AQHCEANFLQILYASKIAGIVRCQGKGSNGRIGAARLFGIAYMRCTVVSCALHRVVCRFDGLG
ncbi:MAG TPA: hypothetical protein DDY39_04845, partial [Nitrospira sp.]|nr:hypothetical protein [Nitrospira sp.]